MKAKFTNIDGLSFEAEINTETLGKIKSIQPKLIEAGCYKLAIDWQFLFKSISDVDFDLGEYESFQDVLEDIGTVYIYGNMKIIEVSFSSLSCYSFNESIFYWHGEK